MKLLICCLFVAITIGQSGVCQSISNDTSNYTVTLFNNGELRNSASTKYRVIYFLKPNENINALYFSFVNQEDYHFEINLLPGGIGEYRLTPETESVGKMEVYLTYVVLSTSSVNSQVQSRYTSTHDERSTLNEGSNILITITEYELLSDGRYRISGTISGTISKKRGRQPLRLDGTHFHLTIDVTEGSLK